MYMEQNRNSQIFQDSKSNLLFPKNTHEIVKLIKKCNQTNSPIEIVGLGSKKDIGKPLQCAHTISLSKLGGIIDYKPEELYIKVYAGTSLSVVLETLKKNNQFLAFDPIDCGYLFKGSSNSGTIGGLVSTNLAGPRRFKSGSVRDHILGFQGINGKGEVIKSGGTVVKNVTGYDLSKLITGAYGTLAVLTEITLKVLPLPENINTLVVHDLSLENSVEILNNALNSSTEVSGAVYFPKNVSEIFKLNDLKYEGSLAAIRLDGGKKSTNQRIQKLETELSLKDKKISILDNIQSELFWKKTQNLEIFNNSSNSVIRIILPPSECINLIHRLKAFRQKYYVDWGGSLIWLEIVNLNKDILNEIRKKIQKIGGYLTLIKSSNHLRTMEDVFTNDMNKFKIYQKIKTSFDPKGIINPGKMYMGI